VRRNLLPSAEIEKEIDALLAGERVDVHPLELVSELGRLGARLVLQRAVEEEVDEWLGRARYERRAEAVPGKRNGYRPRRLQTGEGEIVVWVPQVREACAPFTSKLFRGASASSPPSRCRRSWSAPSCAASRCATSSRSARRPASARSRSRPPPGSAGSLRSASGRSASATSPTSAWSASSWTRSTSPSNSRRSRVSASATTTSPGDACGCGRLRRRRGRRL
jgi:hypothetical protein